MSGQNLLKRTALSLSAVTVGMLAIAGPVAGATLKEVANGVKIDPGQISVSGISSGEFMAQQFHVAHSRNIMGAGIVAGGPYFCASGSMLDAVQKCSKFAVLACTQYGFNAEFCQYLTDRTPQNDDDVAKAARVSFDEAKTQAKAKKISDLAGLKRARIYLFSATHDEIVPHGVMDTVFHFFADPDKAAVDNSNISIRDNTNFPAMHTMVRDDGSGRLPAAVGT